jgi:penicillin-binding protein 1A
MARAFAVFGNQGRDVTPIAIRSVEDRNGKVVLDIERDVRQEQRRMGSTIQVISPQNAYVMTSLLKKTVEIGTLYNPSSGGAKFNFWDEAGNRFRMTMAGKTGTTQNWSDLWTVGYSPYYTTAIWFGFDKPGNSLGVDLTGSTLVGPIWADYMHDIHTGLPMRNFVRPTSGIIEVTVCSESGLLRTSACPGSVTLPYLEGSQPTAYCNLHENVPVTSVAALQSLRTDTLAINDDALLRDIKMPELPLALLQEIAGPRNPQTQAANSRQGTAAAAPDSNGQNSSDSGSADGPVIELPGYNPLLD